MIEWGSILQNQTANKQWQNEQDLIATEQIQPVCRQTVEEKILFGQARDSRVILTKMVMFNGTTNYGQPKIFKGLRLLFGNATSENRINQTVAAMKQVCSKIVWDLLEEPSFPENCWSDLEIRLLLTSLALLDANNFDSYLYYIAMCKLKYNPV